MEGAMSTVNRVVDGLNGEDPAGARMYMAQLRESEARSLLQCFQELIAGSPPPSSSSSISLVGIPAGGINGLSRGRSPRTSAEHDVPPSEFLKVLLEGNGTRLPALHAVLQAMGMGDLEGRAASLCLSEFRMCLAACTGPVNDSAAADLNFPNTNTSGRFSDSTYFGGRGNHLNGTPRGAPRASHQRQRLRVRPLRELATVCLSFIVDSASATVLNTARGGLRSVGRTNLSNRRILMLDVLPAILGAYCAAAADEDTECESSNMSDHDGDSDEHHNDAEHLQVPSFRDGGVKAGAKEEIINRRSLKGKGKRPTRDGRGREVVTDNAGAGAEWRARKRKRRNHRPVTNTNSAATVPAQLGIADTVYLPYRAQEILLEVASALLDRPWAPELALPLLGMFEGISDLLEAVDWPSDRYEEGDGHKVSGVGNGGEAGNKVHIGERGKGQQIWATVRSRLMECVWMGGLDGADFIGVVRQVCILCEAECRRRWDQDGSASFPPHGQGDSGDGRRDALRGASAGETDKANVGLQQHQDGRALLLQHIGVARSSSGSSDWLSCLRRLYAAVPPDWLSTVELVLEQTLHQMPDVAENLLDSIHRQTQNDSIAAAANLGGGENRRTDGDNARETKNYILSQRTRTKNGWSKNSYGDLGAEMEGASSTHDLGLLLLLFREASPLRACSLPLLPEGADRNRRAEDAIRSLLLSASRRGLECDDGSETAADCRRSTGKGGTGRRAHNINDDSYSVADIRSGPPTAQSARARALASVGDLVRGALCFAAGVGGRGSSSTPAGGGCAYEDEVESSSVASERASQLMELAMRWLEEGPEGDRGGRADGVGVGAEEFAPQILSVVFDAVPGARPILLRTLLSGVVDRSHGGAACARSYLVAWETLMAQEATLKCHRLAPHSGVVSDVLGRLTLLPRDRARRVVESMLPLADACPSHASALISLCRKCSGQAGSKGRILALHAITCILVWNARRDTASRASGGYLSQDGVQEDLVGMFRRAMERGLQLAARADALHLLTSKVFTRPYAAPSFGGGAAATAAGDEPRYNTGQAQVEISSPIDLDALNGLRQLMADRLFRFFVRKADITSGNDMDSDSPHRRTGGSDRHNHAGADGFDTVMRAGTGKDRSGVKGKGKKRAPTARGARYRFIPLRLLEGRRPSRSEKNHHGGGAAGIDGPSFGDAGGKVDVAFSKNLKGYRRTSGAAGVVPRDAIGHLITCCWALMPESEEQLLNNNLSQSGTREEAERVVPWAFDGGPTRKRTEAEAIACAVLGSDVHIPGTEEVRGSLRRELAGKGNSVCTSEGEALLAVVDFLAGGGCFESVPLLPGCQQQQQTSGDSGGGGLGDGDRDPRRSYAPPSCHPGLVGPLPALAVVVSLTEALAECLLGAIACTLPASSNQQAATMIQHRNGASGTPGSSGEAAPSDVRGSCHVQSSKLLFWAVTDSFTLLAAAARAAEGLSEAIGASNQANKSNFRRRPEGLSGVIASLPGEVLGLSLSSSRGVGSTTEGDEDCVDSATRPAGGGSASTSVDGGCKLASQWRSAATSLMSPSSALAYVNEFLTWSTAEWGDGGWRRSCSGGNGKISAVEVVSEGWDGGIGVWLALTHSVRTLARSLECSPSRSNSQIKIGLVTSYEDGKATSREHPSGEEVINAIFQLRRVVGTPTAAGGILGERESSPITAEATSPESVYTGTDTAAADAGSEESENRSRNEGGLFSPRPPPGAMVKGFLKRMSARWKLHLDWGLPGLAPAKRASPRLERSSSRRRRGFYNDYGEEEGEGNGESRDMRSVKPEGLRQEADDLFYALRGELLHAERLVFHVFLRGDVSSQAGRRWVVEAALSASAVAFRSSSTPDLSEKRQKFKTGGDATSSSVGMHTGTRDGRGDRAAVARCAPGCGRGDTASGDGDKGGGEEPEAGSGPARSRPTGRPRSRGRALPSSGEAVKDRQESMGKQERGTASAGRSNELIEDERLQRDVVCLTGNRCTIGANDGAASCLYWREREVGESLGRLCCYTAMEMRQGLETGLSVKLTQAYLDLVELLGNVALEVRDQTLQQQMPPIAHSDNDHSLEIDGHAKLDGGSEENYEPDAGEVLLSILTCHRITQVSLFQRLIRGALRYEGVGKSNFGRRRRHVRSLPLSPTVVERSTASLTDQSLFSSSDQIVTGRHWQSTADTGRTDEAGTKTPSVATADERAKIAQCQGVFPAQERCCRLLVHCIRWIRRSSRNSANTGGRRRSAHRGAAVVVEETGENDSSDEAEVVAGWENGAVRRITDRAVEDAANDSDDGRYDLRPKAVIMAGPRECYAALTRALLELETALLSATASFRFSGMDHPARGSNSSSVVAVSDRYNDGLAEALSVIAGSLCAFFESAARKQSSQIPGKEKSDRGISGGSGPVSATPEGTKIVTKKVSSCPSSAARQDSHHNSRTTQQNTQKGDEKSRNPEPTPAVYMLPEAMKLRLIVVLGRLHRFGRTVALAAFAALAKPPPPPTVLHIMGPPPTAKGTQGASSISLPSSKLPQPCAARLAFPPPRPSTPSSAPIPTSLKRQRLDCEDSGGKPGDKAAGVGSSVQPRASTGKAGMRLAYSARDGAKRSCSSPWPAPGSSISAVDLREVKGAADGPREHHNAKNILGNENVVGDCQGTVPMSSELVSECMKGVEGEDTRVRGLQTSAAARLISIISPAAAVASGSCLELMSAARAWAEAERSQSRQTGEDSCRKKASTLLFKIDRCEMEIGKAAQKARQYLALFEKSSGRTNSAGDKPTAVDKKSTGVKGARSVGGAACGGETVVGGGKRSAKAASVTTRGTKDSTSVRVQESEGLDVGKGVETACTSGSGSGKFSVYKCDEMLERTLWMLVTGADALESRRHASVNRENHRDQKESSARGNRRNRNDSRQGSSSRRKGGSRSKRRKGQQKAGSRVVDGSDEDNNNDSAAGESNSEGGRDSEVEESSGKETSGFENGFLFGGKRRRRRSRGRGRVRSRNTVIDGWLEEGGDEADDAYVDLEDFIVG